MGFISRRSRNPLVPQTSPIREGGGMKEPPEGYDLKEVYNDTLEVGRWSDNLLVDLREMDGERHAMMDDIRYLSSVVNSLAESVEKMENNTSYKAIREKLKAIEESNKGFQSYIMGRISKPPEEEWDVDTR